MPSMITYKIIEEYTPDVKGLVVLLCNEIDYVYYGNDIETSLQAMFKQESFVCAGAYDGGELVGVIAFFVYPQLYNFEIVTASEQFWYVLPSYRKGVGMDLVKYIENNLKVDTIEFGISNPRLMRLVERNGYRQKKTILEKVLVCAEEEDS